MKAMILAAGRGERMWPLTAQTPKPLLQVGGKALIEWHVEKLVSAGFQEIVVNVSHLGQQLEDFLGSGERWDCRIRYSREAEPLETAGGIQRALPLLGADPFLLVNGDIWTAYDFVALARHELAAGCLAHLVLVENPPQHALGDFRLLDSGLLELCLSPGVETRTYTGMAIYHSEFFAGLGAGKLKLLPVLEQHILESQVSGEYFQGEWEDVGTPERLAALDARLGLL